MPADGYYQFWIGPYPTAVLLFFACFAMSMFLSALFKLAKSRTALLLIFSKALASMVFNGIMFLNTMEFILFRSGQNMPLTATFKYILIVNRIPSISIRLHLPVMAYNRVHAVYFPINYAATVKRRFIAKLCLCIWAISCLLAPIDYFLDNNNIQINRLLTTFLLEGFEPIAIAISIALYLLMGAKMIWLKWKKTTVSVAMKTIKEKDHVKISIACLTSILPFLLGPLTQTILSYVIGVNNINNIVLDILITLNVPLRFLAFLSEEICLLLICSDFQHIFRVQFQKIGTWILYAVSFGRYKNVPVNGQQSCPPKWPNKIEVIDGN